MSYLVSPLVVFTEDRSKGINLGRCCVEEKLDSDCEGSHIFCKDLAYCFLGKYA